MKNPHLRAKLAEVLEAIMPHLDPAQNSLVSSVFHRKRVFCSYRQAAHLAEALLKVFVDIEFTGEAARPGACQAEPCVHVCLVAPSSALRMSLLSAFPTLPPKSSG